VTGLATFPSSAPPASFEYTMPVTDFLVRDSASLTGDSYVAKTVFRFKYVNGIPSAPILEKISVICE
jgi:hypothetical protein